MTMNRQKQRYPKKKQMNIKGRKRIFEQYKHYSYLSVCIMIIKYINIRADMYVIEKHKKKNAENILRSI